MLIQTRMRGLLHDRADGSGRVTPLELFFDLVFVLAVTQLTHYLAEHLSLRGAVETLVLLLAVWRVWVHIAITGGYFDLGTRPARVALLGVALGSLVMSASIPTAFAERGLVFAAAFVAIKGGWSLIVRAAVGPDQRLNPVIARVLFWEAVVGVPMLAGGLVPGEVRLALWLAALALIYGAMWLGFPVPGRGRNRSVDYPVAGKHLAHRAFLFVILALGESIIVAGANLGALPASLGTTWAFVVAFVGSAALWWLSFDREEADGRRVVAAAGDPAAVGLPAYAFAHVPMVAGVVAVAAGDELAIAHPGQAGSVATTAVILGGPVLFLLGDAMFRRFLFREVPRSRPVAIAALVALAPAGAGVSIAVLSLAATVVLVALAAWDVRAERVGLGPVPAGRGGGPSLRGFALGMAADPAQRAEGRIGGGGSGDD